MLRWSVVVGSLGLVSNAHPHARQSSLQSSLLSRIISSRRNCGENKKVSTWGKFKRGERFSLEETKVLVESTKMISTASIKWSKFGQKGEHIHTVKKQAAECT